MIVGLPYRLSIISYTLFKNNRDFRSSLISLYMFSYRLHEYSKIEILCGTVYINCNTLAKLLISSKIKHLSKGLQYEYLKSLRTLCLKNMKMDLERSEEVEFVLSKIETKEGSKISIPHYTKMIGGNSLHATSKIPIIDESQKLLPAMKSLTKDGVKSPASILSMDVKDVKKVGKSIFVNSSEFNAVIFDYIDIYSLPISRCEYTRDKDLEIQKVLFKYTNHPEEVTKELRVDLRSGRYNYALSYANDTEILDAILEYND